MIAKKLTIKKWSAALVAAELRQTREIHLESNGAGGKHGNRQHPDAQETNSKSSSATVRVRLR
jgi:hypothetical protein